MQAEFRIGGYTRNENVRRRRHAEQGAGRREKRRKLVGGGCGRHPGGRRTAPWEEVVSGYGREVWRRRTVTDAGGGRMLMQVGHTG